METSRQEAFQKLRQPCIELSSVALKFRGQQASIKSLLKALETLHTIILELGQLDAIDEKLAEYAFFPLSNIFNESQRLSSRCLELAVQCLQILVSRGWRQRLKPEMGKQLLILLSLLAGGLPTRSKDSPPSEELICACFECMSSLFEYMGKSEQHIFNETAAKTIVDQNAYLLLEAITHNSSDNVQFGAANALQTLLSQISNRVLLASLLPRTVSAFTKALTPTTQIRRTHKFLVATLELLSHVLQAVLADEVATNHEAVKSAGSGVFKQVPGIAEESTILDDKWLKATASQVKLALANVVKLRSHGRQEVQNALFQLCLMVCEKCSKTLSDSLQLMVDAMVMLANRDEVSQLGREKQALRHLVLSHNAFADLLRNSLSAWISALPRLMQGNDDRPKRQVLRQISAGVQILLESGHVSDLLDDALATSLVDSVSTAVDVPCGRAHQQIFEAPSFTQIIPLQEQTQVERFEPVILGQNSQLESLHEVHALINQIKDTAASEPLIRLIMSRIGQSGGNNQQLAALWLCLNFLRKDQRSFSISDLINIPNESFDTTPYLVSDLYSTTLPLLLDNSVLSTTHDWRISALALESTILQANQLGKSYRPELIDTLYPMLSLLGSPEPHLQSHAMSALNMLATACEYPNTSTMLVENVDYLINSIALKLNTFDISPQGPQVLLMLLRLCGAKLISYLDDLIGSIFVALDNFHGYPRLVELLFEVLCIVVDEAAKNPDLAIMHGMEEPKHRKTAYRPSTLEDILQDIRAHNTRKERLESEMLGIQDDGDVPRSAPHRPWTSKLDGSQNSHQDHEMNDPDINDENEPPSNPTEEEKEPPLSKPHTLLLSIARSTVPHLFSPSPRVRLTLLQLLTRIAPILARHENTFLPLVNDIWPAILPRLFSSEHRGMASRSTLDDELREEDPAYVTVAAADTISSLCVGAGDFMSGRIEDIFPDLERLYRKFWTQVEQDRARKAQHRGPGRNLAIRGSRDEQNVSRSAGANLKGAVDLRIINPVHSPSSRGQDLASSNINTDLSTISARSIPNPAAALQQDPPAQTQNQALKIHTSLLHLLSTILTYTRIKDSTGDRILALVGPIMDEKEDGDPGRREIREALEVWNADAVWVFREERWKMEAEDKGGGGEGE